MKKEIKKNTILITGGGGLIGGSLIYNLEARYKIICLDHGDKRGEFIKFPNVKFVNGEITDAGLLDKVVRDCDIIIHLAGGGGNPACVNNPVWAAKTHILGTDLLLKKALKYKIKKFIFASSQAVYTTFHERTFPFKEDIKLEPDDFYGTLKKTAEDLIRASGMNYSILRFSNIYGRSDFQPLQTGGAINNFIKSAFEENKIQIYGSGKQGIDYVNLKDVARAIILVLEKKSHNDIYNVGGGELVQIKEIAEMLKDIFNNKTKQEIKIKNIPASADKIWPDRLMSIKKIAKDLKWQPEISLRKGLEEMIINYSDKI